MRRRVRLDLVLRRGTAGLFFGLLPGLAAAFLAGTFALPFPPPWIAACCAAAGLAAGAAAGILARIESRDMLVRGDGLCGAHELSSTALELSAGAPRGRFADAVIADAASLLRRTAPRRFLGRLRLPLAPFIPLAAALIAAALVFPLDLRKLFPLQVGSGELVDIGEDLQGHGRALEDAARASNLGRSLALSQELAHLGRELAARRLTLDEALDRMSDLEGRLAQEYQLALRDEGAPRDSTGQAGQGPGNGESSIPAEGEQDGTAGNADPNLKGLGDALKGLRDDSRRLSDSQDQDGGRSGSAAQGQSGGAAGPNDATSAPRGSNGLQGSRSGIGSDSSGGNSEGPSGEQDQQGRGTGSQPGNAPAPQKTGEPMVIARGSGGPGLKAEAALGEGDMARLLARSLPDPAASKLPDAAVLNQYARQAESALARDEVPQRLREYVKGYFTNIGMPGSGR
jgi:hypothetical protein